MFILNSICRSYITVICKGNLYLILWLTLLSGVAIGQSSTTDGTTPSALAPGAPAGSYALSGFDNINLHNGHLNFHLPLMTVGGRGAAKYTMTVPIEHTWRVEQYPDPGNPGLYFYVMQENWWDGIKPWFDPGVLQGRTTGETFPNYFCPSDGLQRFNKTITRLTFTAADGTEYELRDQLTDGQPYDNNQVCAPQGSGFSRGTVFKTSDGSSATFISDGPITDQNLVPYNQAPYYNYVYSGFLIFRDGTRYRIDNGRVTWIRDINGNKLAFTRDIYGSLVSITDSLNRVISFSSGGTYPATYTAITYTGFGGIPRTIKVWQNYLSNRLRTTQPGDSGTPLSYQQLFPEIDPANGLGGPDYITVVSAVELPDGRQYQFFYNTYGELARVVLPTGGAFEYDHAAGTTNGPLSGSVWGGSELGYQVVRRVVQKREYTGTSISSLQGITSFGRYSDPGSNGSILVDHFKQDGTTRLAREKHYYSSGGLLFSYPTYYSPWYDGKETKTESFDTDGLTLKRKTENTWQQRAAVTWWTGVPNDAPSNDPRLVETVSTLAETNQVSKQSAINPGNGAIGFDQYNNQTDVYEYNFGSGAPGALIRHNHTDYKTDGYDTIAGGINNPDATATIHIRSLPSQQKVYDANGIERARATYEYDTTPLGGLVDRAGITGLVSRSGQAAGAGYIPTSDLMRGNVTKVTRWLLASTGPNTSDTGIFSSSQYDVAGNIVKARDPKGNDTTFDYSDSFGGSFTANTFAFLKSASSPIPAAPYGGGQALASTSVYDFSSGKVVQSIDPNNKLTSFEYTDPLDRLTKVIRPSGGGQTIYNYGDAVGNLYLHTQTQQSTGFPATVWIEDRALFDGLGRATRSAHYEGSDFFGARWSVRDNRYDALGRVSQVSNPEIVSDYNAALPGSAAWTTTTYDALSRVTRVTTPDGAHVDSAYLGNQVTVADQTGKQRSSITDGLGRLIQVNEAPNNSAYNYQTNYTYDTLGNLIRVRQGGFPTGGSTDPTVQFRRFYYDSLSRLVYANNPEQNATVAFNPPGEAGTMWTMKYEYDDNGNLFKRTDARGVLTTYGYDALNRNTTVEYSNTPTVIGPDIKRYYDTALNGKGRLQRVQTTVINPQNNARADSRTVINEYDDLGRVKSQSQGFWKPATLNWQDYTVSRTYDLASHVKTQSYPSGGSPVSYNYGAGGRTSQFDGYLGGEYYAYSSGMVYNAAGQMTEEQFGMTVPLFHTARYNNRFQMFEVNVGTFNDVGNPASSAYWNRGRLRFFYNQNALTLEDPSLAGVDNNGNVLRQEHWVPTVTQTNQVNAALSNVTQYAMPMRDDYFYDPINRITRVEGRQRTASGFPGQGSLQSIYQQAYSYDKFGNRKLDGAQTWGNLINGTDKEDLYDVDKLTNRLAAKVYDPAGNLQSLESVNINLEKLNYDAENRMTSAQSGSSSGYYVYDGDGRRVRRIVNGVENWQVYGIDGELLAEYQWNGTAATLKKEYGYRDGQLLVVADPTETTDKKVQWLIADHLGTPRMTVDKTGSLSGVTRHDYLPFGEELTPSMGGTGNPPMPTIVRTSALGYQQTDSVRQKFTGYERDTETGLDFAEARYFASQYGRFSSIDPLRGSGISWQPQSWNRYTYCLNNPLSYIDPTGLLWLKSSGDDPTYNWVDDDKYDSEEWEGWEVVPDGTRIYLGWTSAGYVDYNDLLGSDVTLNADGTISPADPEAGTIVIDSPDKLNNNSMLIPDINYAKAAVSLFNAANAGRLYAKGTIRILVGVGVDIGSGGLLTLGGNASIAMGFWNIKSAMTTQQRAIIQANEATRERISDATWKNFYGVLPYGHLADDPSEPSYKQVWKQKLKTWYQRPIEFIGEIGTISP